MESLSFSNFQILYSAALASRRYEREMTAYQNKPLLSRIFSFPPRNPVPGFRNSGEADEALSDSLRAVFPKLSGFVPGSENPGQYKLDVDISITSPDDTPVVRFKVTDRVHHTESELIREFDPEYGMIPMYQHDSDPVKNAANRRYAASREYRFKDPVLRGAYDEFTRFCGDYMRHPEYDGSLTEQKVSRENKSLQQYKSETLSDKVGNVLSGYSDLFNVIDAADYIQKENWRRTVIKECLEYPSSSTEAVRRDFDAVDETLRQYAESGALLRDSYIEGVAVGQSFYRPSLEELYRRSRIVSSISDPNFFLGKEGAIYGYSKEDIAEYLVSNRLSAEGLSYGWDRQVNLFNTAVSEMESLSTMSLVVQTISMRQENNREYIQAVSSLIDKGLEEGKKIPEIALEMAQRGVGKADFIAAYSHNSVLLDSTQKAIDAAFETYFVEAKKTQMEKTDESKKQEETKTVETVVGVKDSDKDYDLAMARIKEELDKYKGAGENPDKAVVAGITGYYCGVKGVDVDSMSRALSDAGITGTDDNLFALNEYESGMKVHESIEKDEQMEKGVQESKTVGIKR